MGPELNGNAFITVADLGISEEGTIMGFPRHTWVFKRAASFCLAPAFHHPLASGQLLPCIGRRKSRRAMHTHRYTDTGAYMHIGVHTHAHTVSF